MTSDGMSAAEDTAGLVASGAYGLAESCKLPDAAPASASAGAAPELLEALDVLAQAVTKLLDRGKQPRAAGVKSEMQKIISGTFDQTAYGYETFRDFLHEAQDRGIITVVDPSTRGVDTLVTLPGRDVPAPVASAPSRRRGRIRPDIWRAFTSWETGYSRLWDLETGQILMFPTDPRPLEPRQHQLWRELTQAGPGRFQAISVIAEDQLIGKMSSFVDALDPADDAVPILRATLLQAKPARSFTAAAQALPGIAERWKQERFDFIWDSIIKWQKSNGIQSSIEDRPVRRDGYQSVQRNNSSTATTGLSNKRPVVEPGETAAGAIRERIFAALARMPTSELLRLRVPVEYIIDQ
jgi:hypothetical protein